MHNPEVVRCELRLVVCCPLRPLAAIPLVVESPPDKHSACNFQQQLSFFAKQSDSVELFSSDNPFATEFETAITSLLSTATFVR